MASTDSSAAVSGLEIFKAPASGLVLAYIIRKNFRGQKYNFPTPRDYPLQLGINFYKAGEIVKPHRHPPHARTFQQTQEFVTVSEGAATLRLYDTDDRLTAEIALSAGDSVLLVAGGHSLAIEKDAKITEIKLGPYDETHDKVHF